MKGPTFMGKYILDEDGVPMPEEDIVKWGEWMEKADRTVMKTKVGEADVSTVFLGLDHAFTVREHVPILYETLVFGGPLDQEMWRYCTREEALRGHVDVVERLHQLLQKENP